MATKVKSFTGYKIEDIENKINNWLEKENGVEIVEVSQSQNIDGDIVTLIFYQKVITSN